MYVCWDGEEWEWPNYNENDLTPDQSLLTSVETDGVLATSVSQDPNIASFVPNLKASNQIELRTDDGSSDGDASSLDSYSLKLEPYTA